MRMHTNESYQLPLTPMLREDYLSHWKTGLFRKALAVTHFVEAEVNAGNTVDVVSWTMFVLKSTTRTTSHKRKRKKVEKSFSFYMITYYICANLSFVTC